ncbi:hypothetical protein RJT34_31999 [Clitoria ternatea]|uniref:Uncharacterized protein n=1 Tax=Clitoria ternatea TaxID=43366 RepID=A0AAN9EZH5_CLITE
MILKALMEEKQLDFNQPLLSVRRFSTTVASENDNKRKPETSSAKLPPLPSYKSELKSGPVTNPGTVPFVWERTPGRPKNVSKLQTQAVEQPSVAPKLPPGRVLRVEQQDSDQVHEGMPVTQSKTGSSVSNSQSIASLDNKVTKHERPREVTEEKESSGSDDGDEAYLDALDTLSRTESFFMRCSTSGLSSWDDQEVQVSGNLSTDQQARDFMMGRFLPAAKAMASETPQIQHNYRKPPVTQEQPKLIRKVVSGAKPRPLNQKWQKVLPHYAQDIAREESEDESDDNDVSENYATKVCGLFPRFCLLNPIPGLRMEDRILNSAAHEGQGKSIASHRRTAKEHGRTANYGMKSIDTQSGFGRFTKERDFLGTIEKSNHGIYPHRRGCSESLAGERTQFESSCESPVVEKTLYIDSVHKVKSSTSCSSDTNQRGDDFETSRKDTSIDKIISIDSSIEDRKHMGNSMSLGSSRLVCSENSNDDMQVEMKADSNKICSEKLELAKPDYQGNNLNHDVVAISSPEMVECKKIDFESKVSRSKNGSDGLIQNTVSWRNMKSASDLEFISKNQQATQSVDQEYPLGSSEDPSTLASSKVVSDAKIDLGNHSLMNLSHGKASHASTLKLPLALPVPKAPSESWLKRTLPTVSSRNIFSRSNHADHFHEPSQTSRTALLGPKWEKIVKSSHVNHGHLQFAEGLLPPIPEA